MNNFDVLVVYTESVAASAGSIMKGNLNPFSLSANREHYALGYSYFLNKCRLHGLKAAFTTSKDITGPGTCKNYWEFKNNKWYKFDHSAFAPIIFDKVSPLRLRLKKKRDLLFSNDISKPFNDKKLLALFNDKLKTYKKLEEFAIPTVKITLDTVIESLLKLETIISSHENQKDFSTDFILKDRFGAGGTDIYKIGKKPVDEITKILKDRNKIKFVLQPFTRFEKGFSINSNKESTDVRIIYSQGEVVQRYLRTAKENDFRCNEHQGGKVTYINKRDVPVQIANISNEIISLIDGGKALFALDFIISNNGNVFFLEGNINPGIYWGLNSDTDKVNTKSLIRIIVKEIKRRTELLGPQVLKDTYASHSNFRLIPYGKILTV